MDERISKAKQIEQTTWGKTVETVIKTDVIILFIAMLIVELCCKSETKIMLELMIAILLFVSNFLMAKKLKIRCEKNQQIEDKRREVDKCLLYYDYLEVIPIGVRYYNDIVIEEGQEIVKFYAFISNKTEVTIDIKTGRKENMCFFESVPKEEFLKLYKLKKECNFKNCSKKKG